MKVNHPEHLDAVCERAEIGRSRKFELLKIGSGDKTIEQSREEGAKRQRRSVAKKKESVSIELTDSAPEQPAVEQKPSQAAVAPVEKPPPAAPAPAPAPAPEVPERPEQPAAATDQRPVTDLDRARGAYLSLIDGEDAGAETEEILKSLCAVLPRPAIIGLLKLVDAMPGADGAPMAILTDVTEAAEALEELGRENEELEDENDQLRAQLTAAGLKQKTTKRKRRVHGINLNALQDGPSDDCDTEEWQWQRSAENQLASLAALTAYWDREFKKKWRQYSRTSELLVLAADADKEWPALIGAIKAIAGDDAPPPGDTKPKAEPVDLDLKAGPEGPIAAEAAVAPERSMEQTPIPRPQSASGDPGEFPDFLRRAKAVPTAVKQIERETEAMRKAVIGNAAYMTPEMKQEVIEGNSVIKDTITETMMVLKGHADDVLKAEVEPPAESAPASVPAEPEAEHIADAEPLVEKLVWSSGEITVFASTGPGSYSIMMHSASEITVTYFDDSEDDDDEGIFIGSIKIPRRLSKRAHAEAVRKLFIPAETDWEARRHLPKALRRTSPSFATAAQPTEKEDQSV